jgi:cellulose synthase/poly-beta-1,6-N-acetylglucosamine synthase-like glycosyltransferase
LPASPGLEYRFGLCELRRQGLISKYMSVLISILYSVAAVLAAAFAFVELRMLWRFLTNRTAIRAASASHRDLSPRTDRVPPTVTIQIPLYNERTTAEQIIRAPRLPRLRRG